MPRTAESVASVPAASVRGAVQGNSYSAGTEQKETYKMSDVGFNVADETGEEQRRQESRHVNVEPLFIYLIST